MWALPFPPPSPEKQPEGIYPISFALENLQSTHEKISFTLTVTNVPNNWDTEDYQITLIQQADFKNSFFKNLSPALKTNLNNITKEKEDFVFDNYLTQEGLHHLKPNSQYTIVLLKQDQIVTKQSISTQEFTYILGLNEQHVKNKTEKYLKFQPKVNELFTDYKLLYIFTTDTETDESTFSTIPKEYVTESWYMQQVIPYNETKSFKIEIYCSTEHPEKLDFSETKIVDGETVYLIYTHPNLILI